MQYIDILQLWDWAYELWIWAWDWTIPTTNIQVIPLCLFIFITDFVLDVLFPRPTDMLGGDD